MPIATASIKTESVIEHFDVLECEVFNNMQTAQALFRAIADRSTDDTIRELAKHGAGLMMSSHSDAEEALHAIAVHYGHAKAH